MKEVIWSNHLESLVDVLKGRLFSPDSLPFERRTVLVPSLAIKSYILQRMAADPLHPIAAGMQILTLPQALNVLIDQKIPSTLQLSFLIEAEIRQMSVNREEQKELLPLLNYLSHKKENVIALSDQLAALFARYGTYGGEYLEQWQAQAGWQQELWKRLFSTADLLCAPQAGGMDLDFPLHIFGFSFLPKRYFELFAQLSNATFYQFSPCQLFWTDIYTDKERMRFATAQQKLGVKKEVRLQLDSYVEDNNPLLANLGKMGRQFTVLLEEAELHSSTYYQLNPLHLLGSVQNDLLSLRNPLLSPKQTIATEQEWTIQLHGSPSLLSEVEQLLEKLLALIDRHAQEEVPLLPKDILVYAPDIERYLPYIHLVFRNSPLDYAIFDLALDKQSSFAQAFLHLLTLPEKGFGLATLLKLCRYAPFAKKWNFTEEELSQIARWYEKAHVKGTSEEEGLDRLLLGLAMVGDENVPPRLWPINSVAWSDADLLSRWIALTSSLKADLHILIEEREFSLAQWTNYLRCLAESYFSLSSDELSIIQEWESLVQGMQQISATSFPFQSMQRLIRSSFSKKTASFQSGYLQAVRFSSLDLGSALPAKVVYLLGMDETAFPRSENRNSLDAMHRSAQVDYKPTRSEEDRYLFLELLLSARLYFICSYQRVHPDDHKVQAPSLAIAELFSYLDKAFQTEAEDTLSSKLTFFHSSVDPLTHYVPTSYLLAKAFTAPSPQQEQFFIPEFHSAAKLEIERGKEETIIVDIQHLTQLARNPLQFYLNRVHQIYLDKEEEDEELLLSALTKSLLRKQAHHLSLESLLKIAEAKGELPLGIFKKLAPLQIQEAITEYAAALYSFHIEVSAVKTLELRSSCKQPFSPSEREMILPAVHVPLSEGRNAIVVGKLFPVSEQGLLFHGKEQSQDLVKAWPQFLLFLNIPTQSFSAKKQLLMTKEAAIISPPVGDPLLLLARYVDYYLLCHNYISPLLPDWSKAFLEGSVSDLARAIENTSSPFHSFKDPYLTWLSAREPLPNAQVLFDNWASRLKPLFEV